MEKHTIKPGFIRRKVLLAQKEEDIRWEFAHKQQGE